MKQTLYEKIKTIVESGNIAITQGQGGGYVLWSSMADNGAIRVSVPNDDIAFCYNNLGKHIIFKDEIEKFGGERFIGIYERPLWRPKVGQKVQLLKSGTSIKNNSVYKVVELKQHCCRIHIECGLGKIRWVSYDCIAPRVEIDE